MPQCCRATFGVLFAHRACEPMYGVLISSSSAPIVSFGRYFLFVMVSGKKAWRVKHAHHRSAVQSCATIDNTKYDLPRVWRHFLAPIPSPRRSQETVPGVFRSLLMLVGAWCKTVLGSFGLGATTRQIRQSTPDLYQMPCILLAPLSLTFCLLLFVWADLSCSGNKHLCRYIAVRPPPPSMLFLCFFTIHTSSSPMA